MQRYKQNLNSTNFFTGNTNANGNQITVYWHNGFAQVKETVNNEAFLFTFFTKGFVITKIMRNFAHNKDITT